jgi:TolB protein
MATRLSSATERAQWIAFETKRGKFGDYEVFAIAPDGSRLVNLTNSWADDVAPVWSPDGRRVAFVSFRDTVAGKSGLGPGSIYVMDFDALTGQSRGNVMPVTGKVTNDGWPTWSPDGRRIAFHSDRSGNWDVWVISLDDSGLTNVTDHPDDDRYPAWSPDGQSIAFTSDRDGDQDVWLMNVDGSNPVNLSNTPGRDRYAMWSPDGRQIAFNTQRDGNQEIYVMEADGSNQTNVTHAPDSIEGLADWSPEGQRLVLYSDRPGNKDVFIVDLTTGRWTNITNHPTSDEFCTWSP